MARYASRGSATAPEPFGPFVLLKRIAVGGSAEVFLAEPRESRFNESRVVVKRLLGEARAPEDIGRLMREARLHQHVKHPNVVTMYGGGLVEEEPYLVMEFVDGVDFYRLLRRAESEDRRLSVGLAAYVARSVADALAAVHEARDEHQRPLDIVHRDVTPTNIYLSRDGAVKLGDFGIARITEQNSERPSMGLKGKFGYLAPEQVAGEEFDHRADLFALSAVLGEALIGRRVFPGSGQLAVLLAIRDADIQPLREVADELPKGLFQLLARGLDKNPYARFASAREMSAALAAFEQPSRKQLKSELGEWVRWAQDASGLARRIEDKIRDSVDRLRALGVTPSPDVAEPEEPIEPPQGERRARLRRHDDSRTEELELPRLIEMIATGELEANDEVAVAGQEFRKIRDIDYLARHLLPSTSATTRRLFEPGVPDYQCELENTPMLDVLARMRRLSETGALFAEQHAYGELVRRKEIYIKDGRLHYVASTEREELLGEYLVRRGHLSRDNLNHALASLSRYGGRLGDTLIGLGLVDAMDMFRAIRDQGRDRVAAICCWPAGKVLFYRGEDLVPDVVNFPLDLDLANTMMAGVILASRGRTDAMLPAGAEMVKPGPRADAMQTRDEQGSAPAALLGITKLSLPLQIDDVLVVLKRIQLGSARRSVSDIEARAALTAATHLGWIEL